MTNRRLEFTGVGGAEAADDLGVAENGNGAQPPPALKQPRIATPQRMMAVAAEDDGASILDLQLRAVRAFWQCDDGREQREEENAAELISNKEGFRYTVEEQMRRPVRETLEKTRATYAAANRDLQKFSLRPLQKPSDQQLLLPDPAADNPLGEAVREVNTAWLEATEHAEAIRTGGERLLEMQRAQNLPKMLAAGGVIVGLTVLSMYVFGGLVTLLVMPALCGVGVVALKLDPIVNWMDRFGVYLRHNNPLGDGSFAGAVMWLPRKVDPWTTRIEDAYQRAAVRLAGYLYFISISLSLALAVIAGLLVVLFYLIVGIIFLALLLFGAAAAAAGTKD